MSRRDALVHAREEYSPAPAAKGRLTECARADAVSASAAALGAHAMSDNHPDARREMWTAVALLWLAGNALRITILAVPPVIAMIRDEFALSATEVGLLSSVPPALFAIAALAGSLLGSRLGVSAAPSSDPANAAIANNA